MFEEKNARGEVVIDTAAAERARDSLIQQAFILLTGHDGVNSVVIMGSFGTINSFVSTELDGRRRVSITAHPPLTDEPPAS